MDYLYDADLSDLASDEGPPFGSLGVAAFDAAARRDLAEWLLRWN